MKIIIAGAGEVGSHLAKMLSNEYHDLTIIDNDEARLNRVSESAAVVTIFGSPTSITTLSKAGAASADLFIAVSPAQEQDVNIISSLLAKKMGSTRVTARINNDEYLENDNKILFTEMGIDLLFYPEKIASHEIIDLLKQTGTSEFMDFSGGKLQLIAFRLDDGAPLIDKTIGEYMAQQWYRKGYKVKLGGPAYGEPAGEQEVVRRKALIRIGIRMPLVQDQQFVQHGRSGAPVAKNENGRFRQLRLTHAPAQGQALDGGQLGVDQGQAADDPGHAPAPQVDVEPIPRQQREPGRARHPIPEPGNPRPVFVPGIPLGALLRFGRFRGRTHLIDAPLPNVRT